jgi:hypothetical protein
MILLLSRPGSTNIWLCVMFERMRRYGLKINPLKCNFGVSAGRFLGFIVHEHGIPVHLKKVESINKLEERTCKRDVQKLLWKVNYLRRFISNLVGKVESFMPLVRLKHEKDFAWGAEQSPIHPYSEHPRLTKCFDSVSQCNPMS